MPNTDETFTALTALSKYIWEQKRYFEGVRGYSTLETEKTKAELLEQVANKLDDIIVSHFPLPAAPDMYLRRAESRLKARHAYMYITMV